MPAKRLRKAFLVIGLGYFGRSVARSLVRLGHEVLGVDKDMAVLDELKDELTEVVQMDATQPQALAQLSIPDFDACIVGRGTDLAESITITMLLKDLGATYVIAKAMTDLQARILERIGADRIVFPERDSGERLAHSLVSPRILDFLELAPNYSLQEITAPPLMAGKTLGDLNLRREYGINVVVIKSGDHINPTPHGEDVIHAGDVLVIVGRDSDMERFLSLA